MITDRYALPLTHAGMLEYATIRPRFVSVCRCFMGVARTLATQHNAKMIRIGCRMHSPQKSRRETHPRADKHSRFDPRLGAFPGGS